MVVRTCSMYVGGLFFQNEASVVCTMEARIESSIVLFANSSLIHETFWPFKENILREYVYKNTAFLHETLWYLKKAL